MLTSSSLKRSVHKRDLDFQESLPRRVVRKRAGGEIWTARISLIGRQAGGDRGMSPVCSPWRGNAGRIERGLSRKESLGRRNIYDDRAHAKPFRRCCRLLLELPPHILDGLLRDAISTAIRGIPFRWIEPAD